MPPFHFTTKSPGRALGLPASVVALVGLSGGCSAPTPAAEPPPPVVSVAEPAAVPAAAQAPPPAIAAEPTTTSGCPFPPPAEQEPPYAGPVPAAPVLGTERPAPRATPAELELTIARSLDPLLRTGRAADRAKLQTEARLVARLLKATPASDKDYPRLLERLAHQHVELSHAEREAGDPAAEQQHRAEAIRLFEAFAQGYPSDPALDGVLYHLALERQRSGDAAAARKTYLELVSSTPQSKRIPYVYFGIGEQFAAAGRSDPSKLEIADRFYEQALRYSPRENPLFGLALYRRGELFWQRRDATRALELFVRALRHATRFPRAPEADALRSAALDALIDLYVEVGRPDRACPFLHRFVHAPPSPAATLRALTSLGEAYLRYGRRADALVVYALLERYHRGAERERDRAVVSALTER